MKYILTTEVYGKKPNVTTEFDEFKNAVMAAEHVVSALGNIIDLTRHPSWESDIRHMDFFADHYNEICVKVENEKIIADRKRDWELEKQKRKA
jgi:hypothetical protein